jgi:hypothetical protein
MIKKQLRLNFSCILFCCYFKKGILIPDANINFYLTKNFLLDVLLASNKLESCKRFCYSKTS